MKTLILVDLQNDFVEGGALPVRGGGELAALANRLQPYFDKVIATQDWHPATHGSFAVNHPGKKPGDTVMLNGLPQILWPVHCVTETTGADFLPDLDQTRWNAVFQKGTDPAIDSYSGFFDNGKRKASGMGDFLAKLGARALYIMGLATDYCVKFTALDATGLGFETHLIVDACRGVDLQPGDVKQAVEEMKAAGVRIVETATIFQCQKK